MDLLQTAMQYHLGGFGTVFIAATLALFSFSTFLGVLYYARGNVAYLCGDNWWSQTVYKLIALVMLLIRGVGLGRCGHRPDDHLQHDRPLPALR